MEKPLIEIIDTTGEPNIIQDILDRNEANIFKPLMSPPSSIEQWEDVRGTILDLLKNPYADSSMQSSLKVKLNKANAELDKLRQIDNPLRIVSTCITKAEIELLYPKVNDGIRGVYVDLQSHNLVDKIIELWFESFGYSFWDNPYPDVLEWHLKDEEIHIIYQGSESNKTE
jgi:hypothetical protein